MALSMQGDLNGASIRFREAVGHQRLIFDRQPQDTQFRKFLSKHYQGLALSLRGLGRCDEAAEATRERLKLWPWEIRARSMT